MESAPPFRIGEDARRRLRDQHIVSLARVGKEIGDVGIGESHAAMRCWSAQQPLVIGAVKIDVALQRVASGPAIDPLLDPIECKDAGEDKIIVGRLPSPYLAGRLTGDEHCADFRGLPDLPMHTMPAGRCATRTFGATDAGAGRGDWPSGLRNVILEPDGALALDIHH